MPRPVFYNASVGAIRDCAGSLLFAVFVTTKESPKAGIQTGCRFIGRESELLAWADQFARTMGGSLAILPDGHPCTAAVARAELWFAMCHPLALRNAYVTLPFPTGPVKITLTGAPDVIADRCAGKGLFGRVDPSSLLDVKDLDDPLPRNLVPVNAQGTPFLRHALSATTVKPNNPSGYGDTP